MRITIYDNRDKELSTHTFGTENSLQSLMDMLNDKWNNRDQTALKCMRALKEAIRQAIAEHQ